MSELKVIEVGGRSIGSVPDGVPYVVGQFLKLTGTRWRVIGVEPQRKELVVKAARGGAPPRFGGEAVPPSRGVAEEMRRVLESADVPTFLDGIATQLLSEAREAYARLGLIGTRICRHEDRLLMFPWTGPRETAALLLTLTKADLEPEGLGLAVAVEIRRARELKVVLTTLAAGPSPDGVKLADQIKFKAFEKYNGFLEEALLALACEADQMDAAALPQLVAGLLAGWQPDPGH